MIVKHMYVSLFYKNVNLKDSCVVPLVCEPSSTPNISHAFAYLTHFEIFQSAGLNFVFFLIEFDYLNCTKGSAHWFLCDLEHIFLIHKTKMIKYQYSSQMFNFLKETFDL